MRASIQIRKTCGKTEQPGFIDKCESTVKPILKYFRLYPIRSWLKGIKNERIKYKRIKSHDLFKVSYTV